LRFQLLRRFFDGFVFFFAESVGSRAEEGLGSGWGGVDSGAGGADGAEYNMAMIVLANQRPRGRVNPMNCACAPAACRAENARAAKRATTTHQRLRRGSNPLFPALWSRLNTVSMDARQKQIPSRNRNGWEMGDCASANPATGEGSDARGGENGRWMESQVVPVCG
jgi:hypothetical protein